MIGQITVTTSQAKNLIAASILNLPEVTGALKNGKVVLKSGTTVAFIAKELGVSPPSDPDVSFRHFYTLKKKIAALRSR